MSWRTQRAKEIWEGILDGDTPQYTYTEFSDVEDAMEEIDGSWSDYEIETHINKTFIKNDYKRVKQECGDLALVKK